MSWNSSGENPYESPRPVQEPAAQTPPLPARSFMRAGFPVGDAEQHLVTVDMRYLSGRESYLVDGVEVLRTHSWWGRRRFDVGDRERHSVEIHVTPLGRVRVLVDGDLRHSDLLPDVRWIVTLSAVVLLGALFYAGAVAMMALLNVTVFRVLSGSKS